MTEDFSTLDVEFDFTTKASSIIDQVKKLKIKRILGEISPNYLHINSDTVPTTELTVVHHQKTYI